MTERVRTMLVVAAIAVAGAALALATVTAPAHAEDKKPAPKPKPTTLVFEHYFDTASPVVMLDTPGSLEGRLHIVVETTFDADGQVAERRLHANLMNAFVTSLDGSSRVPATGGGSEVRPAQACTDGVCPADVWTVRFEVPKGGSFTLRLATRYDGDGMPVEVSVLRPIVG
jgi:hypothetical protein